MWRFVIPGAIFAVLIGFFVVGLNRDPGLVPSPLIGKPAPSYSLSRVEDPTATIGSADMRGTKHLVNIWATWCVGCREEHPFLMQLARQNLLPIIGIDWKDELPQAQQWLRQFGNPYVATGFDRDGRVAIDFGVYGAPETFLIDENGVVIYKHIGVLTPQVWQNKFVPLLSTGSGAGA